MCTQHFGSVAANTVRNFKPDQLPLLLLISRSRSVNEVVNVIHGQCRPFIYNSPQGQCIGTVSAFSLNMDGYHIQKITEADAAGNAVEKYKVNLLQLTVGEGHKANFENIEVRLCPLLPVLWHPRGSAPVYSEKSSFLFPTTQRNLLWHSLPHRALL